MITNKSSGFEFTHILSNLTRRIVIFVYYIWLALTLIWSETIKKYNKYYIINNKFKIYLAHKKNYQLEFLNRELEEKIKKIREEWIYAQEYNIKTNERPTKKTKPYHCSRCLRPLKYSQTNQLLNKISCNKCVDSISYYLYYYNNNINYIL